MPTCSGAVLASCDDAAVMAENVHCAEGSLDPGVLHRSDTQTHCPCTAEAHDWSLEVDAPTSRDAACCYPEPYRAAATVQDHVPLWRAATVVRDQP